MKRRPYLSYSLFTGLIVLVGLEALPAQATSPGKAPPGFSEVTSWLETNIPLHMERSKMPGFSIALVKDGETIYTEGFGLRDPSRNLPATPDTLYGIGSITKNRLWLTATAKMANRIGLIRISMLLCIALLDTRTASCRFA